MSIIYADANLTVLIMSGEMFMSARQKKRSNYSNKTYTLSNGDKVTIALQMTDNKYNPIKLDLDFDLYDLEGNLIDEMLVKGERYKVKINNFEDIEKVIPLYDFSKKEIEIEIPLHYIGHMFHSYQAPVRVVPLEVNFVGFSEHDVIPVQAIDSDLEKYGISVDIESQEVSLDDSVIEVYPLTRYTIGKGDELVEVRVDVDDKGELDYKITESKSAVDIRKLSEEISQYRNMSNGLDEQKVNIVRRDVMSYLKITKLLTDGGVPFPESNAKFKLVSSSGEIDMIETDSNGVGVSDKLSKGRYTLTQIEGSDEYSFIEPIEFEVNDVNDMRPIEMELVSTKKVKERNEVIVHDEIVNERKENDNLRKVGIAIGVGLLGLWILKRNKK